MPWEPTGGSFSGVAGGGSTKTIEETNTDTGETRTTETTRGPGGRLTGTRRTTRDPNGRETDFEETTVGPPATRRTRKTKRAGGKEVTEEEEFINGVRRRSKTSTFFPEQGKFFVDEIEYDENGEPTGKSHHGPGYDYHHDLRILPALRLFRGLAGGLAIPARATAGTALCGTVGAAERGKILRGRIKNAEGRCVPLALGPTGRFVVPPAFTTAGDATVELLDQDELVTHVAKLRIEPAQNADVALETLKPHEQNRAVAVASGRGLVIGQPAEFEQGVAAMPILVLTSAARTTTALPIAYSDLEVHFATPSELTSVRLDRGGGDSSSSLDCPFTAPEEC